jgi:alkylation response protein AidB-like acyl-CoA dehydrogenase
MAWMDLTLSQVELRFQQHVHDFLDAELKPEWRGVSDIDNRTQPAIMAQWQAVLAEKGWLTAGWPVANGGLGWSPMQHHIFKEACSKARAPKISTMSIGMIGPLICAFGTPAQQAFYLPRIVNGADIWCQGFSEPGSGSDLASLKTTARREGDAYVVSGQKIWTTYAHLASQMFCLVRTDVGAVQKQAGISMLLMDMALPGITVRPIHTIDGEHHFNEVFFDDVRVPITCLLGGEHQGWDVARALLAFERSGIADVVATRQLLNDVAAIAAGEPRGTSSLLDDDDFANRLTKMEIALDSLEIYELRVMEAAERGAAKDFDASILKILGSELKQKIHMLGIEALDTLAAVWPDGDAPAHPSGAGRKLVVDALFFRAGSIYGGANEIQRNIVAKSLLKSGSEI